MATRRPSTQRMKSVLIEMKKRKGFTLIELFIVLGVISVISGTLIPIAFNSLNQAKVTDVLNYVRELYMAQLEYYVREGETTDLDGLRLYMSSDWIDEHEDLFTNWNPGPNSVAFTVAFGNKEKSRALLAMFEDTNSCTACFLESDDTNVRVAFRY